jgi:hypothetical protein
MNKRLHGQHLHLLLQIPARLLQQILIWQFDSIQQILIINMVPELNRILLVDSN